MTIQAGEIVAKFRIDKVGATSDLAILSNLLGTVATRFRGVATDATAAGVAAGKAQTGFLGMSKGTMAGVAGLTILAVGVAEVATKLGELGGAAIKAALDEEASKTRLAQSLKENATDWSGNTDAIEANILSMDQNGFSADTLRQGLAQLVQTTHSVATGFKGLQLAEDIARGRGISLNEATMLVAKTYAGNYTRAIKAAGLSLEGITTKEQALALLQRTFAGQAAAYALTTQGQMDALNNSLHDTEVSVGEHLTPAMQREVQFVRTDMVPTFNDLLDKFNAIADLALNKTTPEEALGWLNDIPAAIRGLIPGLDAAMGNLTDKVNQDAISAFSRSERADAAIAGLGVDMTTTFAGSLNLATVFDSATKDLAGEIRKAPSVINSAMDDLMAAFNDPLAGLRTLAQIQGALTSQSLADGLKSGDSYLQNVAEQTQQKLLDEWKSLTGNDYQAGDDAQKAYADALAKLKQTAPAAINSASGDINNALKHTISGARPGIDQAVAQLTTGLAQDIRDSKSKVASAMDDLKWAMLHPLAGAKALARIQGDLTSKALGDALQSGNPYIRSQAEATKATLIAEWEKISGKAYTAGDTAATQYHDGLATFKQPTFSVSWPTAPNLRYNVRVQAFAEGGPVAAGVPIIVGEKRPELFVPKTNGYILPRVPDLAQPFAFAPGAPTTGTSRAFSLIINGGVHVTPPKGATDAASYGRAVIGALGAEMNYQATRMSPEPRVP